MRDELLTPAEVADWLRVPLSTLRIWRHRREGRQSSRSAGCCASRGGTWRPGLRRLAASRRSCPVTVEAVRTRPRPASTPRPATATDSRTVDEHARDPPRSGRGRLPDPHRVPRRRRLPPLRPLRRPPAVWTARLWGDRDGWACLYLGHGGHYPKGSTGYTFTTPLRGTLVPLARRAGPPARPRPDLEPRGRRLRRLPARGTPAPQGRQRPAPGCTHGPTWTERGPRNGDRPRPARRPPPRSGRSPPAARGPPSMSAWAWAGAGWTDRGMEPAHRRAAGRGRRLVGDQESCGPPAGHLQPQATARPSPPGPGPVAAMTNPRDHLDALLPPRPGRWPHRAATHTIPAGAVPPTSPSTSATASTKAPGRFEVRQTAGLVAAAVEWGLDDGQVVAVSLLAGQKYGKRVEREAARLLRQVPPRPPGTSASHATGPAAPTRRGGWRIVRRAGRGAAGGVEEPQEGAPDDLLAGLRDGAWLDPHSTTDWPTCPRLCPRGIGAAGRPPQDRQDLAGARRGAPPPPAA